MDVERPSGATIVNAPWVTRNFMDRGYEKACAFVDRDYGNQPAKPAGLLPARWASTPGPLNDYLYGRHPVGNALDLICDFCPNRAVRTALYMMAPGVRRFTGPIDQAVCSVCPSMIASQLVTGRKLRIVERW
ncbi:MAG: hypothetical protein EA405_02255 [Rhodospirillales bacterium]|nr:MAG: hypothetical protein EA405_02255 [Rhodospirillales bacterium]